MPFFCPREERSGRRVGIGHRDPSQRTRPHNPTHLVSPAPKCDRNALRFEGKRAPGPIWRGLPGASSWSGAPGSAGFPLGQALPGADDLLLYGLVTRVSCPAVLRFHQAGSAPRGHVHFDLEKASGTERKQVHRERKDTKSSLRSHPRRRVTHRCICQKLWVQQMAQGISFSGRGKGLLFSC